MWSLPPTFKISAALLLSAAIQGLGLNAQSPDQDPALQPPTEDSVAERDLPLQGQIILQESSANISETPEQSAQSPVAETTNLQPPPNEAASQEPAIAPDEMQDSPEPPPLDAIDSDLSEGQPPADTELTEFPAAEKEQSPEETLLSNSPFLSPLYFMRGSQNTRLFSNTSINPVEFRAAVYLNGKWQFSLYDTKDKRGFWVSMDDTAAPYRIISYNEQTNSISVDANGMITEIPMSIPSDVPLGIAAAPGVLRADTSKNAKANAKNQQPGKVKNRESTKSQAKAAPQQQSQVQPATAPVSNNRQNANPWAGQRRRIQAPITR